MQIDRRAIHLPGEGRAQGAGEHHAVVAACRRRVGRREPQLVGNRLPHHAHARAQHPARHIGVDAPLVAQVVVEGGGGGAGQAHRGMHRVERRAEAQAPGLDAIGRASAHVQEDDVALDEVKARRSVLGAGIGGVAFEARVAVPARRRGIGRKEAGTKREVTEPIARSQRGPGEDVAQLGTSRVCPLCICGLGHVGGGALEARRAQRERGVDREVHLARERQRRGIVERREWREGGRMATLGAETCGVVARGAGACAHGQARERQRPGQERESFAHRGSASSRLQLITIFGHAPESARRSATKVEPPSD